MRVAGVRSARLIWAILLAAAAVYATGLSWGLPSSRRAAAVLEPGQRSDDFYKALERNRGQIYETLGLNLQAAFGRSMLSGKLDAGPARFTMARYPAGAAPSPELMHGFSSFVLRSVEQDEQFVLNTLSRLNPRRLQFNPHESLYGGAYIYSTAAFLGALHVLHLIRLVPDALYYYRDPGELARLYLAARTLTVLAGLACVFILFKIGSLLYDQAEGLWAAVLFGFSPAVNAYAHVLKPHLWGLALGLGGFYFALKRRRGGPSGDWVKAALCFGLAVGSVKNLWGMFIPMAAVILVGRPRREWPAGLAELAKVGLLAVATFFAVNPYVPFEWGDFMLEMKGMARWYQPSLSSTAIFHMACFLQRIGLGAGVWALSLAGLALALRRRSVSDWTLAASWLGVLVATSFLFAGASTSAAAVRFFLPGLAFASLLGAAIFGQCRSAWIKGLGVAAVGANLAWCLMADANFSLDAAGKSNSFDAGRWIMERLPAGEEIGLPTPAPTVDRFPPIPFSRYEIVSCMGPWKDARDGAVPRYFVMSEPAYEGMPEEFKKLYAVEKVFDHPLWPGIKFRDPFTSANFSVVILRRNEV